MTVQEVVFGPHLELISRYIDMLSSDGVTRGLIGPREVDRLWERHILNSVAVSELLPEGVVVVDVGSGAGLPGIPLAVLRPDLRITLLEPLLRRSTFLTETVEELGLVDRVEVVRARAEDHRQAYDVVLSRALAPLDRLVGWCEPLRAPDGVILAVKGRSAEEEVVTAARTLLDHRLSAEVLSVRAHPSAEPTTVVRVRPVRR